MNFGVARVSREIEKENVDKEVFSTGIQRNLADEFKKQLVSPKRGSSAFGHVRSPPKRVSLLWSTSSSDDESFMRGYQDFKSKFDTKHNVKNGRMKIGPGLGKKK
jgi:hypothetical protein